MDSASREAVVNLARSTRTHLLIDEAFRDLPFPGSAPMPPPMALFDNDVVISIGSLSKSFSGGLRVGWIRAPRRLIEQPAAARVLVDMARPRPTRGGCPSADRFDSSTSTRVEPDGMVAGMATTMKVTVTLPVESVEAIRRLVTDGKTGSVSGFVQHAVQMSLDDVAGWGVLLSQALADTGGAMSDQERQWADQVLGGSPSAGTAA